ncbi:hypothetical protein [Streptomyces sp. NPDC005573]|uniref:hypothetical protein n=1 Tax=Streptomyces sp. NPDC005573 TaxID=3156890 RepID=UPI0033BA8E39
MGEFGASAPPPGNGPDRCFIAAHAVDTKRLDVSEETTPACLGSPLYSHALARAVVHGAYAQVEERPTTGAEHQRGRGATVSCRR